MSNSETVREVCAEIYLKTYDSMFRTSNVIGWRDRILSAYEREMAAKDAEIARLKAALKPVMECSLENERCVADGIVSRGDSMNVVLLISAWQDMSRAVHSVREARRIMKEGEAK